MTRRWIGAALDAVLPWTCLACGRIQGEPGLCPACWSGMPWIAAPCCARCGAPFAVGEGDESARRCAACAASASPVGTIRTALRYDGASRPIILGFKHADRLHAAPLLARWLLRAGHDLLGRADLVAPVPLHWSRLAWRRYNQAAEMARPLARLAGRPYAADLLVRRRRTPSQGALTRDGRRRNVGGAFAVGKRWRTRLAGRHVLLVDDVVTTGATLEACARALLDAGAGGVDALAVARVVDPLGGAFEPGTDAAAGLSSAAP